MEYKKNIGIITNGNITQYFNYGGMLQAVALVKVVEIHGYAGIQIQVLQNKKNGLDKIKYFLKFTKEKGVKYQIETNLKKLQNMKRKISNEEFAIIKNKFIEYAKTVSYTEMLNEEKLEILNQRFDIFIAGSDQVWNPKWIREYHLLEFTSDDKTKISYAASIGRYDFTKYEKQQLGKCVNRLQAVSVREYQAAEFIKENYGVEAKVVLDPTMLLTAEQWEKEEATVNQTHKFIFCYFLNLNEEKRKMAQKVADILDCEIIYPLYVGQTKKYDDASKGEKLLYDIGPKEWLYLVHHAEYILTDSFHGTVFSILYQKPFYHILRSSNRSKGNMNSRMDTLMKMFHLEDRYLSNCEEITEEWLKKQIDYEKVDEILEVQRKSSMDFLLNQLESE